MNKWIGIAMALCASGCAMAPETTPETATTISSQEALAARPNQNTVIDEEVLYLLMAAELAGQRDQYDLALDAYLQAAKRVEDARIAERAVRIGMFLKDGKRTREALDIWLSKDEKNLPARKFAVLLAVKSGDRESAVENLDAILLEDPAGFETGMLEMVKGLEKEGRLPFMDDVLSDLALAHPDDTGVLFLQAVVASLQKNNEVAQQKIGRVLELQPDWNKAIIFQAQLAGRSGDMDKAREYLQKAYKQAPDDKQLRKMLLEVLMNTGAFDDAIRLCQASLDENPEDGEMLFMLAMISLQQAQVDKAESHLEKLLGNKEWEAQASFYLGKIELDKQHADKALQWFDRAGAKGFGFDADLAAISLLLSQKDMDEVETRMGRLNSKYPDKHLRILLMKAELYNQTGRYQEAYDMLTEALKEAPESRDVLYARALVAERLGRLDVLEADLGKILQSNPDDVGALNAMGYTLTDKTERYDEAERHLQKALHLKPDEAVIIDSYGWLQFKRGKYELALEYLRKAYEKQPENEIAAHIAEVLWVMGKTQEAKDFFIGVFKRFPDDEYLLNFKNRFLPE
ncbi:tetratricopeptide repeat protein [Methylomonas sp. HYX-M1]|uniref:tetratricopeptide repeat protein n=1 Tax=Methylomonas sp. HYX-M1 TaxID=3139307 RepID=UPI00345B68A3